MTSSISSQWNFTPDELENNLCLLDYRIRRLLLQDIPYVKAGTSYWLLDGEDLKGHRYYVCHLWGCMLNILIDEEISGLTESHIRHLIGLFVKAITWFDCCTGETVMLNSFHRVHTSSSALPKVDSLQTK